MFAVRVRIIHIFYLLNDIPNYFFPPKKIYNSDQLKKLLLEQIYVGRTNGFLTFYLLLKVYTKPISISLWNIGRQKYMILSFLMKF